MASQRQEQLAAELSETQLAVSVPRSLVPAALPTNAEQLQALLDLVYRAGRADERQEAAAPPVSTALAVAQPAAHQVTINVSMDGSTGDCMRQVLEQMAVIY